MRRLFVLCLIVLHTTVALAQSPLANKKVTFQEAGGKSSTMTYASFHKKLTSFFANSKATPSVPKMLSQLEPYLKKNLTEQDKSEVNRILKNIGELKETKNGKQVSILETRVALGSFVSRLKSELSAEQEEVMNSDTVEADGTAVVEPDTTANLVLNGTPVEKSSGVPVWVWWAISGISALAALALGYLYMEERKKRERLENQAMNTSNQASRSSAKIQELENKVQPLIKKTQEYENAIRQYENALKDTQTKAENERKRWQGEVENLQNQINTLEEQKEEALKQSQQQASTVPPVDIPLSITPTPAALSSEEETFYLSTPNKDGSFRDLRATEFDPSQSLYQVKLLNPLEAEFEFIDEPELVSEALRFPETFVEPVCEYGGGIQYGARHIVTIAKGKLIKTEVNSDRWELLHKAIIRFES